MLSNIAQRKLIEYIEIEQAVYCYLAISPRKAKVKITMIYIRATIIFHVKTFFYLLLIYYADFPEKN